MQTKRAGFLNEYFYFFMSLLIAAVVFYGFGRELDHHFLHPSHKLPFLLTIHATIFTAWILFYVLQSALVRTRNVRLHRSLGWFGFALGCLIPIVGTMTAVVMRRFDMQFADMRLTAPLLRTALLDLSTFTIPFFLAIYWRNRPEYHRRLILLAACGLTASAFVRFPRMFHPWPWYYVGVDLLVLLAMLRDQIVDHRVHKIYRIALPTMIIVQFVIMETILQHLWLK